MRHNIEPHRILLRPTLPAFLVAAALPLLRVQGQAQSWCRLASLALRFEERPLDLIPSFDPETYTYAATLEFGMDAFYVDTVPGVGCQADQAPIAALPVAPGGEKQLTIFAKDPKTDTHQAYNIRVTRLRGSETEVHSIRIEDATLQPGFNAQVRRYTATLAIGNELATMAYVLADTGQKVHCAAMLQQPTTASDSASGGGVGGDRRLAVTGEVQYQEHRQSFPIDVGFTRRLTLTVQSTDPEIRERGAYIVDVMRPGCTSARPLYDPLSRACVVHCPSAFYPNAEAQRCSKCNSHCAVCFNIMECQRCEADTEDASYTIQPDGSCRKLPNGLLERWLWWVVGMAMFFGLLLCACICFLCERIWACCCGKRRHRYDSDSDE